MHIGFESVAPYPLERRDTPAADAGGASPRPILRVDRQKFLIRIDAETTLAGVPWQALEYRLGSRSVVEWVLDQYKERRPRDPTIAARFGGYRFAGHKERVIDLLGRVCAVSVRDDGDCGFGTGRDDGD